MMFAGLKYRFIKKKITEDFRDYLFKMVFAIGEIYDHVKESKILLSFFIEEHCKDTTVRQQVYLNELMRRLNDKMTDRKRVTEFTFEYFFILNEDYSSEVQMWIRDDFIARIEQAFDANGICR